MSLREELLKSPAKKRIEVEYMGHKAELVAPSIKERKAIMEKAGGSVGTVLDMQTWVAIFCTVEPGTNKRVFEDTDVDVLENGASGNFLDTVGENLHELLNIKGDSEVKKPEEKSNETTKQE